jgi:hypothetical protein
LVCRVSATCECAGTVPRVPPLRSARCRHGSNAGEHVPTARRLHQGDGGLVS